MTFNIRNKLILFAVLAIVVPLGLSALIILLQLSAFTSERSKERIQSDARVASQIFAKRQENLRSAAQSIAQTLVGRGLVSAAPATPPAGAPPAATPAAGAATPAPAPAPSKSLQDSLETLRKGNGVDFVAYLDPKGKIIAQHNGAPQGDGMFLAKNPLFIDVNNAPTEGPQSGPAIEETATLTALGLAERAAIKDVNQGLFLEAAAPVMSGEQVRGVILLGQLVNRDESGERSIVNEIKSTLYPTLQAEAAAIIALGDTTVSTTLPGSDAGGSATGVKLTGSAGSKESPSFNQQTFGDGSYYTSYVPVAQMGKSTGQKDIGRIGVAIRESWFTAIIGKVRWTIIIVSLIALLLAIGGAIYAANRLTQPIIALTDAANRISLGELDVPIAVQSADEIGTLGEALDRMRISLKGAIERLRKR